MFDPGAGARRPRNISHGSGGPLRSRPHTPVVAGACAPEKSLDRQPFATLGPAATQHGLSVFGSGTNQETMGAFPTNFARLICFLAHAYLQNCDEFLSIPIETDGVKGQTRRELRTSGPTGLAAGFAGPAATGSGPKGKPGHRGPARDPRRGRPDKQAGPPRPTRTILTFFSGEGKRPRPGNRPRPGQGVRVGSWAGGIMPQGAKETIHIFS